MTDSEVATLKEFARTAEQNMRDIWKALQMIRELITDVKVRNEGADSAIMGIKEKLQELRAGQIELGAADRTRDEIVEHLVSRVSALEATESVNHKWLVGMIAIPTAIVSAVVSFVLSHWPWK